MVCSCPIPVVTTRSISSRKQGRRCLSLPVSMPRLPPPPHPRGQAQPGPSGGSGSWTWSWSWRSSSEKRSPTPFLAASLELYYDWQWEGPAGAEPALLWKVTAGPSPPGARQTGGIPRGLCASCPQAWHHRGCPAASRSSALPAFLQPARGSKIGLCSAPLSQSGAVICLNSRLFLMKVDGELWVEGRYFINHLGRVEASSSWRAPGGGRSPGRIRNPVPLGLRG